LRERIVRKTDATLRLKERTIPQTSRIVRLRDALGGLQESIGRKMYEHGGLREELVRKTPRIVLPSDEHGGLKDAILRPSAACVGRGSRCARGRAMRASPEGTMGKRRDLAVRTMILVVALAWGCTAVTRSIEPSGTTGGASSTNGTSSSGHGGAHATTAASSGSGGGSGGSPGSGGGSTSTSASAGGGTSTSSTASSSSASSSGACHKVSTLHPPPVGTLNTIYCPFSAIDGGANLYCTRQTEHCCEPALGTATCNSLTVPCPAGDTDWACEDPTDCPSGYVCCAPGATLVLGVPMMGMQCGNYANGFTQTVCQTGTCTGIQICESTSECPAGKTCVPFNAKVVQVGGCM
jgi:hypothetical protein